MDSPFNILGMVHCINSMGHRLFFSNRIAFLSLKIILSKQLIQTLMKCHIMQHFIWVFTVCYRAYVGVTCILRVKFHRPSPCNLGESPAGQ